MVLFKNRRLLNSVFNQYDYPGGCEDPRIVETEVGLYVLAFDQALNPEITNPDQLEIESADIEIQPKTGLPSNWFGTEIYILNARYNNKPVKLKLVPFAEAGQTGGEVRVWMKEIN